MRLFLVQALIAVFAVLIVLAVIFRSVQAQKALRFLRDAVFLYVIALLAFGVFLIIREAV
jgi:hypothetical protein